MRFLVRIILIPLGWLCGLSAATAVLVLGAWWPWLGNARGTEEHVLTFFGLIVEGSGAFVVIGGLALLPSLLAIVIAEAFSIRTMFYYAGGGLVMALAPLGLTEAGAEFYSTEALAGAGLAGGIVYWLVAGQGAGVAAVPAEEPH